MKPTDVAPVIRLMRFQAQNYKCLRDVSFDLTSPLAVFVGRNNTGKSAILDVFDFIREAADNPINATQKRGTSLSDIIWRLADGAPCHMELRFDVPDVLRDQAIAELEAKKQPNLVTRLSTDQLRSSPFLRRLSYQVSFGPSFHEQIATANPVSDEIDFPGGVNGRNTRRKPVRFKTGKPVDLRTKC